MPDWDAADLLARCRRTARRPDTDQDMGDPDWYALLTEAEVEWVATFAAQVPFVMLGAPVLLTTGDGGLTYTFPNGIRPLAVQLFDAPNGRLLRPGAYWDETADYVWEGDKIRFPRNATKTFADGPYARFITPPNGIAAGNEPTLQPDWARILVVYRACIKWANRGGFRDPAPYEALETRAWYGDPQRGDVGILGTLKMQNPFYGTTAVTGPYVEGLAYLNVVHGYTPR